MGWVPPRVDAAGLRLDGCFGCCWLLMPLLLAPAAAAVYFRWYGSQIPGLLPLLLRAGALAACAAAAAAAAGWLAAAAGPCLIDRKT